MALQVQIFLQIVDSPSVTQSFCANFQFANARRTNLLASAPTVQVDLHLYTNALARRFALQRTSCARRFVRIAKGESGSICIPFSFYLSKILFIKTLPAVVRIYDAFGCVKIKEAFAMSRPLQIEALHGHGLQVQIFLQIVDDGLRPTHL